MQLTSEHLIGASGHGLPENLAFIDSYAWQSSAHMKEAIKILLSARLDSVENNQSRFEGEIREIKEEVQLRLASNPETSAEVLEYLSRLGERRVCERIATNPGVNKETLEILSKHAHPEVRASVSENPLCSEKILYRLLRDGHPDVRLRLAENPNLPVNILQELCEDENPFVADRAIRTQRRSDGCVLLNVEFGNQFQRNQLKAVN